MIKYKFKLKGHKKIPKKLDKILTNSKTATKKGVKDSAEFLNELAMQRLDSSRGSSWTGEKWGHSYHTPIANSKSVSPVAVVDGKYKSTLAYTSEHAAVVEFGSLQPRNVTENRPPTTNPTEKWYTKPPTVFPIGQSQGSIRGYATKFRIQRGYHYLTNSIYDIRFTRGPDSLEGRTGRYVKAVIDTQGI